MPKQRKQKSDEGKKIIHDKIQNYGVLFRGGIGKEVLEDLKIELKYGENLYSKNITVTDLYYEMGRQSVINDILSKIKIAMNK